MSVKPNLPPQEIERLKKFSGFYKTLCDHLDPKMKPSVLGNYFPSPPISNMMYYAPRVMETLCGIERTIVELLDSFEKKVSFGRQALGSKAGEFYLYPIPLPLWYLVSSSLQESVPPTSVKCEFEHSKKNMQMVKGAYHQLTWNPDGREGKNGVMLPRLANEYWFLAKFHDRFENLYRASVNKLILKYSFVKQKIFIGFEYTAYMWCDYFNTWIGK